MDINNDQAEFHVDICESTESDCQLDFRVTLGELSLMNYSVNLDFGTAYDFVRELETQIKSIEKGATHEC